jgi:hypothetical protein
MKNKAAFFTSPSPIGTVIFLLEDSIKNFKTGFMLRILVEKNISSQFINQNLKYP